MRLCHHPPARPGSAYAVLTGEKGREAYAAFEQTGDESLIRTLFDELLGDVAGGDGNGNDDGVDV